MTDEPEFEYTMGGPREDAVKVHVFRAASGRRMAVLRGDDGQRVEIELADVPRLIHMFERILVDARQVVEDEQRRERAAARERDPPERKERVFGAFGAGHVPSSSAA